MPNMAANFMHIWRRATTTRKIGIVLLGAAMGVGILTAWTNMVVGLSPTTQTDVLVTLTAPVAIGAMLCRLGGSN